MKGKKLYWILGALLVVLIGFAIVGKQKGWIGNSTGTEIEIDSVQHRNITEIVSANGTLFSAKEVKISSEVSGEIIGLYVKEGDSVRQGQLLVEINPATYRDNLDQYMAQLNQMKANAAQARARYRQAESRHTINEKDFTRKNQLLQKGVIATIEMDQVEATYLQSKGEKEAAADNVQAAEYQIKSAEASYNQALKNLNKTKLYAPMSGIVSSLSVELGERVVGTAQMSGTELLRVADLNSLEARVDVNENAVNDVHVGDSADLKFDAFRDKSFSGIVVHKAQSSNKNAALTDKVINYIVKVRVVPNPLQRDLRPGMTVTAEIKSAQVQHVLSIPIQCVTSRDTVKNKDGKLKEVVFAYSDNKVKLKEVETGIQDDSYIEIKNGLALGEKVVSGSYRAISKTLKDGDKVKIEKPTKGDKKKEEK